MSILAALNSTDFRTVSGAIQDALDRRPEWIKPQLIGLEQLMRLNIAEEVQHWGSILEINGCCSLAQRLALLRLRLPMLQFPFDAPMDYIFGRADAVFYTVYADEWAYFNSGQWRQYASADAAIQQLCRAAKGLENNKRDKQIPAAELSPKGRNLLDKDLLLEKDIEALKEMLRPKTSAPKNIDYLYNTQILNTVDNWINDAAINYAVGWTCQPVSAKRPKDELEDDYTFSENTRLRFEDFSKIVADLPPALALQFVSSRPQNWLANKQVPTVAPYPSSLNASLFVLCPLPNADALFEEL